jgi:uncharacterized membrane protein SpoIIM required for sporulation/ABC-type transport system involved in multi-copper enzyme maturation permease subunit
MATSEGMLLDTLSSVRIIARREVRETLTDWRILAPIFILTFIMPQLLLGAIGVAVDYIDDDNTVIRLIPFAMLLVGFIPASFSLITSLESFVGERERNSLESLLSMPISDFALYLGKLLAALLPPLLSSLLAMCVFAASLRLWSEKFFFQGLLPEYFAAVILLILTKSIVMVAGAVIISSHTTSIRAANLLASFVLLPTAALVQFEALLMIAQRWDALWMIVISLVMVAIALIRTGLGSFNREEILSREHEQLNLRKTWSDFRRFLAEYQPAGIVPADYAGLPFSAQRFYSSELPRLLAEYRLPIGVAVLAALVGALFGVHVSQNYPIGQGLMNNIGGAAEATPLLALSIFANNLRVALFSNLISVFSFGFFAFLVPSVAFAQIGFVAAELVERGGSWLALGQLSPVQFLLAYVLPHGIIELPTAILSAALGLRIGASLMLPPAGFTVGQNMLWSLAQFFKVWALVLLPLFLIAGLIEGLIVPYIVRALYGG